MVHKLTFSGPGAWIDPQCEDCGKVLTLEDFLGGVEDCPGFAPRGCSACSLCGAAMLATCARCHLEACPACDRCPACGLFICEAHVAERSICRDGHGALT